MINYIEKYHHNLYYLLALLFFGLFLLQRIPFLSLKIATATPCLLLPALLVTACFLREWTGFWAGLLSGIALDTVVNGSNIFNTLTLTVLGVAAGLIFRFFMNRNIKAIIIAGGAFSFIYYLLKWFFLDLLSGDASWAALLFKYHIPSALYTALFTIPLFFLVRWLCNKYLIEQ